MGLSDLLSLFKRTREEPAPPEMTLAEARGIAVAYGDLLKKAPVSRGTMVADVRELPHPKETVKRALQHLYKTTKDRRQRDAVGVAYVSLANFQAGVGRSRIWFDVPQPRAGGGGHGDGPTGGPTAVDKWKDVINADTNRLMSDLVLLNEQLAR